MKTIAEQITESLQSAYKLSEVIEQLSPILSKCYYYESNDPEADWSKLMDPKDWAKCIQIVPGSKLLGFEPSKEASKKGIGMIQIRLLTRYTDNFDIKWPKRPGFDGDIIIEIMESKHQEWGFFNYNKELKQLEKYLSDVFGIVL